MGMGAQFSPHLTLCPVLSLEFSGLQKQTTPAEARVGWSCP